MEKTKIEGKSRTRAEKMRRGEESEYHEIKDQPALRR